jgi:hypothetical protein
MRKVSIEHLEDDEEERGERTKGLQEQAQLEIKVENEITFPLERLRRS